MPIVSPSDSSPPKPAPTIPGIAKAQYRGVTVDTKMEPLAHLLSHVEGSSWTVQYYSQVIDLDSSIQGQGMGTNAVHQQYRMIRDMELKVTSPLTSSQNADSNNMTHRGSANVYPFVIPNVGDMFLADIGSGREGLFQITSSQRMSVFKQAVHTIEYAMVDYSTAERRADLDEKTVQKLVYDKDFLQYGQNPLLFEEEYDTVTYLRRHYKALAERYFKMFFSREFTTMIVPGQQASTYDHYLVKFLLGAFTTWDTDEVRYVRQLNTEDDYSMRATSVWSALENRDRTLLNDSFRQYGKVSTKAFSSDPMLEGIRFSRIEQVVYPVDPLLTVDYNQVPPQKLVSGIELDKPPTRFTMASMLEAGKTQLNEKVPTIVDGFSLTDEQGNPLPAIFIPPVIHRAMADGYYVFSKAFYENNRQAMAQSQLELMVHDYLDVKALNLNRLKLFCSEHESWNTMDRFYFTPVLLMLIKAAIRTI